MSLEKYMPVYGRGYTEGFFRNTVRSSPPPAAEAKQDPVQPLAIAFVRDQEWENIYTGESALARGTLFADLYLPLGTLQRGGGQLE